MDRQSAQDIHQQFQAALNAGDIDALMALYEPSCALLLGPGNVVEGLDAVRKAQLDLMALHGEFRIETREVVEVGDLALVSGSWSFNGSDANGAPVTLGGITADVLRCQPDGRWLYVIDVPRICPSA